MESLSETNSFCGELKNETAHLKKEKETLVKKLDEVTQQLHETKRQLTTSKLMEEELTAELESLTNENKSVREEFTKEITFLKERVRHSKAVDPDRILQLENQLEEKQIEIKNLNQRINNASKENDEANKDDIDELNRQVYELKRKLENLSCELNESRLLNEEMNKKNMLSENKISEYESNLEEMKEFLSIKKAELEASNERFQNLQEELMMTRTEINKINSVPLDKAQKGNSLFAEVEDNRQKLKKYIQIMNKKYSEIKASYNRKILEMQNLRSSYAVLKTTINERCNFEDDQERIIESHKKSIEDMMETVNGLRKELELRKELTDNILNGRQKSAEALIEITRKEVVGLREKLTNQAYSRMASENALYTSQVELKKWRLEALSLRSEILILKQTVDELNNKTAVVSDIPNFEEIDEFKNSCRVKNEKSENAQVSRKVLVEKNEKPETSQLTVPNFGEKEYYTGKYKSTNFCKQRTLTVINDDSFIEHSCSNAQGNKPHDSIMLSGTDQDLDVSFEAFDDDLQIYKNQSNLIEELEQKIKATENMIKNKENVKDDSKDDSRSKSVKTNISKGSRKVCFSSDTVDCKASAPRKGTRLLPKKVIRISSNEKSN